MGSRSWTPPGPRSNARGDAQEAAIDHVVFEGDGISIGAFRCPVGHPLFEDSGPIRNHIFVFPRQAVRLCHAGGRPFVADPGVVTLYNRGQRYWRRALGTIGDESEWFAVGHELLLEVVRGIDPSVEDQPERPFKHQYGPCDPRVYLAQRKLFDRLRSGPPPDSLWIEENVLWLLVDVLAGSYGFWGRPSAQAESARRQQEMAERARELLAESLAEPLGLAHYARELGTSVFRLCKAFRAATGSTLHAYRNQLRLQGALERLAQGEQGLTELALDFGYSSHSHFSAAFRRLFGTTPSAVRRALAG